MSALRQDADRLEALLPQLMRALFNGGSSDPLGEIPVSQLRMIRVLYGQERSSSSVAEILGMTPSATTQMANRLEKSGLLERVHDPSDRRVTILRLTQKCCDLMATRRAARIERAERVLGAVDPNTRHQLVSALGQLIEATKEIPECKGSFAGEADLDSIIASNRSQFSEQSA